jgi:hypothetical protein
MKNIGFIVFLLFCKIVFAQKTDSISNNNKLKIIVDVDSNLVFNGAKISNQIKNLIYPELKIGGYVSTYFAWYDDETISNGFVQFPTLAPRNKQFALNMALLSMEYKSNHTRGNIGLHFGDVSESIWPSNLKFIQEANAGIKFLKRFWFDAGFFKSHIGIESFQSRENITSSMSILSYHEPYFFSGAKLTYLVNDKLTLQANVFNGYSDYSDQNDNKVFGFSTVYTMNDNFTLTYNLLSSDESPITANKSHQRFYNNFYILYFKKKITIGLELNYGTQKNSLKTDTTKTASVYSGLIVAKYQLNSKIATYGRLENFSDKDQILSQTVDIGKYINGTTIGLEYKHQKNAVLSAEWRVLQSDKLIFKQGNYNINQRNEFILCLDLWF